MTTLKINQQSLLGATEMALALLPSDLTVNVVIRNEEQATIILTLSNEPLGTYTDTINVDCNTTYDELSVEIMRADGAASEWLDKKQHESTFVTRLNQE